MERSSCDNNSVADNSTFSASCRQSESDQLENSITSCDIIGWDDGSSSSLNLNVSFSPMITVREVLHVKDYEPDEISNTWYSYDDIRSWKMECRRNIMRMQRRKDISQTQTGGPTNQDLKGND